MFMEKDFHNLIIIVKQKEIFTVNWGHKIIKLQVFIYIFIYSLGITHCLN